MIRDLYMSYKYLYTASIIFISYKSLFVILELIYILVTTDDSSLNSNQGEESGYKMQRRSFYMRLVKKAVSRGEQPEFELVHVVGTLMVQNDGTKSNIKDSLQKEYI